MRLDIAQELSIADLDDVPHLLDSCRITDNFLKVRQLPIRCIPDKLCLGRLGHTLKRPSVVTPAAALDTNDLRVTFFISTLLWFGWFTW